MGVDIQTYRARIGTYSHSQGSDATLVQNFRDDFKTVGCVLFIGILLIIAGIEINPGPKEKETANVTTCAKSSRIKFSQLKENTNEGELKSFFEKQEEIGGGKVKHMYTDSDNNSAIIECEDNLVENRILDNNPLKIDGLENAVDIHVDEDNSSAQSALVRKSLEENIFDQQFASDIDRKNQLGAAERASKFGRKCVKRFRKGLEFFKPTAKLSQVGEASENDNDNLQIVHSGKSLGDETIDQQFGCDCDQTTKMTSNSGHKFRLRNLEGLRNNFESLKSAAKRGAGSFIAMLPGKDATHRDAKKLDSQLTDSTKSEGDVFYQLLQRLELTEKFPGKISLRDVIAIDTNESNRLQNDKVTLPRIPWVVLKRLMCVHSESRDIRVSESDENDFAVKHNLSCCPEIPQENQDISPLDIFTVVFQCCDPVLKQVIVQRLYLCKLAVPFLYRHWEASETQYQALSVWPLRSLIIDNVQRNVNENDILGSESDVLELLSKVVAFGRLGRPRYSKSKLMNGLLLSDGCKTFFNVDCPSGMTPRQVSNGQVEMFWLPTIGDTKDKFQDTITFLNLRGDLGQHFHKDIISFIGQFVDSIVIIVDLEYFFNQSKVVRNVLRQFSSVILIIADPLDKYAFNSVTKFEKDMTQNSDFKLHIYSTYKGAVEQNVVDMLLNVTKYITKQLETTHTKSFEKRFSDTQSTIIKTDEDNEVCQESKLEAKTLIKQMKTESEPNVWKKNLTPVHSKLSRQLGKLLKERERERDFSKGIKLDENINLLRQTQMHSITKTVKLFLDILIKYENSPLKLEYFLRWLNFDIQREQRQILSKLMHEHRNAWEKLKTLKTAKRWMEDEIKDQETLITEFEDKIDDASFTVQNFFREIGHINDAILELKEDSTKLGLPMLKQMSDIFGCYVADGHPFELVDGDSFYMPHQWIKSVIKCTGANYVMSVSVLGLQSSGKSTLLNTMFGSEFAVRTGRCTRGINAQLIPLKPDHNDKKYSPLNYVLLIDTEGLRSRELSHVQHEHDNELATVITGVGDITMLNIMGENISDIRDVLQVIVHAFLRLKMTNKKLDIKKSCAFIHHNVADPLASKRMTCGLIKLMQTLDEMTEESARSEGILDIKRFSQVIECDIKTQVWYLQNLLQGNPPMARVNNEYSENVVDIKFKILDKSLKMKNKSFKSLNDVVEQAHNLWRGVLNEDFVFSFRNSIEIKAYMEMECFVQAELWQLESFVRDKLIQISQNSFATCDEKEELRNVANELIGELNKLLFNEKVKTEEKIQTYFDGNRYKDIIIQWKSNQQTSVNLLFDKLKQIIEEHVKKNQAKRSLEILTVIFQEKHEEELRQRSMIVANDYKGQNLSNETIDQLFIDIWEAFLNKVDTSVKGVIMSKKKMKDVFQTCLENIFKQNHALLKQALERTDFLTPLPNVKQLAKSFCETGINKTDISFKVEVEEEMSDTMNTIIRRVDQIFESVDTKIKELCQIHDEVTEMSVNKLMWELHSSIQDILKTNSGYKFKKSFDVKLCVHVSRHAHPIFEIHNEKYSKTHATAVLLEQYRVQQKISFQYHIQCRKFEDFVAELFSYIIEYFAEKWALQTLPNKVTDELLALLPSVKNRVIIEICEDLLRNGDFENFISYIEDPKKYASKWITEKAYQYLDGQVIANTSSSLLTELFRSVKKCVQEVQKEYERKSPPSNETWIEYFEHALKSYNHAIPSERFRRIKNEKTIIQNFEYLTTKILENMSISEKRLASKFKSLQSHSIKWPDFNPISRVLKQIWGCQEQCPFCGEPCAKSRDHVGSTHYSLQHRPTCCTGSRNFSTNDACLTSCEFHIQSDFKHSCRVFNNICDVENNECDGKHLYSDYKTYLPDWDIAPTSNMHESSNYWIWFVVKYKQQLKEKYGYGIDNIPSSWNNVTISEALESLNKIFSA